MGSQQNVNQEAPNIHSEHIKEEFYKWFESRGLLSDLRAYMRQLMVKALEESNKNGKTMQQRKSSTSPKLQAINLLVVDYLFHEDYLYTVSVFSSEAQMLESLPQYSRYVTQTVRERRWDPSSMPRFSQQETEDILDTLRLPPSRQRARQATHLYLSGHESLLTCVVRTLASSHNQGEELVRVDSPSPDVEVDSGHQLWSQEMQDLLLLAGVKLQHIRRMQQKWAQTIEEEKFQAKKKVEDELAAQQAEWQQTTEQRLRAELMEEVQAEQQQLRKRRSSVEMRERGLAGLAQQLSAVHDDISERLSELQLQKEELQEREAQHESEQKQLEERISQFQIKEGQLDQTFVSFQEQTGAPHELKEDHMLEVDSVKTKVSTREESVQVVAAPGVGEYTQTVVSVDTVYTQTLDTVDHEQQTSLGNQPDPQLLLQLQTDRERINELQEENLELRAHALQQRHRIDELTNRAANLSTQLEESRVTIAVLSGQESAVVVAPPPPPTQPAAPAFVAQFGYSNPQRIGAGEESLFAPRPQQATPRPDGRRRPVRFAFSKNPIPTSEESSPTDEVIQNARARIQQLEEESAVVQRNYQQFQARLLATDSVMFPPLRNPDRIHDSVMRVRRNDVMAYIPLPPAPHPPVSLHQYRSRSRQRRPLDEENDESSSDQAVLYDPGRSDYVTTRRIFTERNIRHYERWKQFKKKFQRRNVLDHSRRNLKTSCSNTSSDDDEGELGNGRKRHEINKIRKPQEISNAEQTQLKVILPNNKSKEENSGEGVLRINSLALPVTEEAPSSNVNLTTPAVDQTEEKLRVEVERSVRLIESVKTLLKAPNVVQKSTPTLSNGSLAVESLPRDSQNGSQNEIAKTENSSVLTVQNIKPQGQNEIKEKIENEENRTEFTIKHPATKDAGDISQKNYSRSAQEEVRREHSIEDAGYQLEEERAPEVQEINTMPLTAPTLRLVSPGLNVASEDFIATVGSDVIEQEGDEKESASVTSGSDILRELNPSKTESSDSVISTGWADGSKHSSDFWD